MLPFTKRPNRSEDAELVDSGEIEVVRALPKSVPPSSLSAPPQSHRAVSRGAMGATMPAPGSQRYPQPQSQAHPSSPPPLSAPPRSERPQVSQQVQQQVPQQAFRQVPQQSFQREPSLHDDEMTAIMPSKRGSSFPPASSHAPRSSTRARPGRVEDEERTMLRPLTPAQSFTPRAAGSRSVLPPAMVTAVSRTNPFVPPPPPVPNGFGLHVQTPPTMLGHTAIPPEVRAQALASVRLHQGGYQPGPVQSHAPAAFAHTQLQNAPPSGTIPPAPPSDPAINPPATVITTRTRVLIGRPTMSWAAALLAMGVFVGLVTAVVARGDADSLIDATASFVDPAHSTAHAAAAIQPASAAMLAPVMPGAAPLANAAIAPISPPAPLAVAPVVTAAVALAPAPISAPAPVNPAPVAPALAPILLVDSRIAPVADTKTVAANDLPAAPAPEKKPAVAYAAPRPRAYARPAPEPKVAAAPKPAPTPRAKKIAAAAASDDDAASAAADKLAREQLEAALK